MSVFSFLPTYADNAALPAFACRWADRAAIDQYLVPAGPTAANLQRRVCCCETKLGQTDKRTEDRQTDTVPLHRPCSVYCVGSANNLKHLTAQKMNAFNNSRDTACLKFELPNDKRICLRTIHLLGERNAASIRIHVRLKLNSSGSGHVGLLIFTIWRYGTSSLQLGPRDAWYRWRCQHCTRPWSHLGRRTVDAELRQQSRSNLLLSHSTTAASTKTSQTGCYVAAKFVTPLVFSRLDGLL